MLSISPLEVVSVSEVAAESVRDSVLSTVILNVSAAVEESILVKTSAPDLIAERSSDAVLLSVLT